MGADQQTDTRRGTPPPTDTYHVYPTYQFRLGTRHVVGNGTTDSPHDAFREGHLRRGRTRSAGHGGASLPGAS